MLTRPAPLFAQALLLVLAGFPCSRLHAQHSAAPAAPTLEEIFGRPPLSGERPSDAAVSGDGSWCIFRLPATAPAEAAPDPRPPRVGRWILARTDGSIQKPFEFQGHKPTVFRFAPAGRELRFVDGKRILTADPEGTLEAAREILAEQKQLDS